MGAGISTGNIKYLFTQAVAPSGEGEVEGSLWYNTTLNRLETFDGSVWNAVISGTGWELVSTTIIAGSAADNINLTGLDIDTDGEYLIMLDVVNDGASAQQYLLTINGDETVTNYKSQLSHMESTTHSISNNATPVMNVSGISQNLAAFFQIWISLDSEDVMRALSVGNATDAPWLEQAAIKKTGTTANITSIKIAGTNTDGMGISTRLRLYKTK